MKLLGTNAKLEKSYGKASQYLVAGLTLAPNRLALLDPAKAHDDCDRFAATLSALAGAKSSGYVNVCPWATKGCIGGCNLWFSGQRVTPQARNRAANDTHLLFIDPAAFYEWLRCDIEKHIRKSHRDGLKPLIRLNVASDLDWSDIIAEYPDCQFYDYTKSRERMFDYLAGRLPSNYALTFSYSEDTHYQTAGAILRRGGNIAAVIDTPYHPQSGKIGAIPSTMQLGGIVAKVIDADKHDVRLPEIDGRGVVCGLRLKGTNAAKARAIKSGFALPMVTGCAS